MHSKLHGLALQIWLVIFVPNLEVFVISTESRGKLHKVHAFLSAVLTVN